MAASPRSCRSAAKTIDERERAFQFSLGLEAQADLRVKLGEHDVVRGVFGVEGDGGLHLRLGLAARGLLARERLAEVCAVARLPRRETRGLAEERDGAR